jgi:hypothetical protein
MGERLYEKLRRLIGNADVCPLRRNVVRGARGNVREWRPKVRELCLRHTPDSDMRGSDQ